MMADAGETTKKLAVVGGYEINRGANNTDCWFLQSQRQEMMMLTQIPDTCTAWHSACKTEKGFAVTGGEKSDTCMEYNTANNAWSQLPNMLEKRKFHGSVYFKRLLYVVGGALNDSGTDSTSVAYMNENGIWQHGPELPVEMSWPKLAVTDDDRLYVFNARTYELFVLSENMNSWQRLASLPRQACNEVSMTAADGKLYVAGGNDHRILACYTPVENTWVTGDDPMQKHSFGPLVHFEQRLYLLGGSIGGFGSDTVEVYDIQEQTWQQSSINLPKSLHCHHGMVLDL